MPRRSTPDPLALAIGKRVQALRGELGMTREGLVVASGLASAGFLSDLERGLALPSVPTLVKLAGGLGVVVADLVCVPRASRRERLFDLTREVPDEMLRRWLREADEHRLANRKASDAGGRRGHAPPSEP